MTVYFIILLIPLLWYLLPPRSKSSNQIAFIVAFTLLFLISSLRDEQMGADYRNYIYYFNAIAQSGDAYFNEKGYVGLNYLLSLISSEYVILAFAVNVFLFIPLFFHIRNNVEDKYWALCVLIFVANPYMYVQTTFNMMRQCCATGIVLIGAQFFKKKHFSSMIVGMIFLAASMLFHRSTALIIPFILPCLFRIRWSATLWRSIFIVGLVVNLSGAVELICQSVASSLSYGNYATYEASLLNNPPYLLLCLIFCWWMSGIYDRLDPSVKDDFFVNLFMLGICLLPIAVKNDMVYRVRVYLQYISLPGMVKILCSSSQFKLLNTEILKQQKEKNTFSSGKFLKLMYVAYFISFFIGYFLFLYWKGVVSYIPFKFIWS